MELVTVQNASEHHARGVAMTPKKKIDTPWRRTMMPAQHRKPKSRTRAAQAVSLQRTRSEDDDRRLAADPSTPLDFTPEQLEQLRAAEAAYNCGIGLERAPQQLGPEAMQEQDVDWVGSMPGGIHEWMERWPERISPELRAKLKKPNGIKVTAASALPKPRNTLLVLERTIR